MRRRLQSGHTVFPSRLHLVRDNGAAGHSNVLGGHVFALGSSGVSGENGDMELLVAVTAFTGRHGYSGRTRPELLVDRLGATCSSDRVDQLAKSA